MMILGKQHAQAIIEFEFFKIDIVRLCGLGGLCPPFWFSWQ